MRSPDIRLCFIGDSFTAGVGDPDALGWVGRVTAGALQRGHDVTAYNLGVRRETSADILGRWKQEVAPRVRTGTDMRIVFCFGANDTAVIDGRRRVALPDTLANARRLLFEARSNWSVRLIGSPPVAEAEHNERIAELSRALDALAHELSVPFLDVFTPLMALPVWRQEAASNDGSHPRAAGYRELAGIVSGWRDWWFGPGKSET